MRRSTLSSIGKVAAAAVVGAAAAFGLPAISVRSDTSSGDVHYVRAFTYPREARAVLRESGPENMAAKFRPMSAIELHGTESIR